MHTYTYTPPCLLNDANNITLNSNIDFQVYSLIAWKTLYTHLNTCTSEAICRWSRYEERNLMKINSNLPNILVILFFQTFYFSVRARRYHSNEGIKRDISAINGSHAFIPPKFTLTLDLMQKHDVIQRHFTGLLCERFFIYHWLRVLCFFFQWKICFLMAYVCVRERLIRVPYKSRW